MEMRISFDLNIVETSFYFIYKYALRKYRLGTKCSQIFDDVTSFLGFQPENDVMGRRVTSLCRIVTKRSGIVFFDNILLHSVETYRHC